MSLPFTVALRSTKRNPIAGEWIGISGQVVGRERMLKHAEVWLKVNGVYTKVIPQSSWDDSFWFSVMFGPGRYIVEAEAYKVRVEGDPLEYKVTSPPLGFLIFPRLGFRPRSYKIENWRRVRRGDVIQSIIRIKQLIVSRYPDTKNVWLIGGLAYRGWTRRDIDILTDSPTLAKESVNHSIQGGFRAEVLELDCEALVGYPVTIYVNTTPINPERIKIRL